MQKEALAVVCGNGGKSERGSLEPFRANRVQYMRKSRRDYPATDGWGYAIYAFRSKAQSVEASEVAFVPPAGVKIGNRTVRFNATGALGGKIGEMNLTTTIGTEAQYRHAK